MKPAELQSWLEDVISASDNKLTPQDLISIKTRLHQNAAAPLPDLNLEGIEVHNIYTRSPYPLPAYLLND